MAPKDSVGFYEMLLMAAPAVHGAICGCNEVLKEKGQEGSLSLWVTFIFWNWYDNKMALCIRVTFKS